MNTLIPKIKTYCANLIRESRCDGLPFHNLSHTLSVYRAARKIGLYEKISPADLELVSIAALFHDIGYAEVYHGHEEKSADHASYYLNQSDFSSLKTQKITTCIESTQVPQRPQNIQQQILCDADLAHLGSKDFEKKNNDLRKEWEVVLNKSFSEKEWLLFNINFLRAHRYHTTFGKEVLEPQKQINLEKLIAKYEALK